MKLTEIAVNAACHFFRQHCPTITRKHFVFETRVFTAIYI